MFERVEEESVEAWLKHHGLENDARTPPNFRTVLGKNKEKCGETKHHTV
jgi:hypothetical protein